jgi:hypothetical protein
MVSVARVEGAIHIGTLFATQTGMSADAGDDELRQSIRERLADGRLFWAYGGSTVRRGTGRPCDVCGTIIHRESTEREVQGDKGTYVLAHEDCFRIWREESRRTPPARA